MLYRAHEVQLDHTSMGFEIFINTLPSTNYETWVLGVLKFRYFGLPLLRSLIPVLVLLCTLSWNFFNL